ncbi:MAG: hypothetical protein EZS28_011251, partial [Streblomastix strix]
MGAFASQFEKIEFSRTENAVPVENVTQIVSAA